jgi:hypothetical protein
VVTVPKKPSKDGPDKLRPDVAETAYRTMLEATGQAPRTPPPDERTEKNSEAARRGKKGGEKGGKARTLNLSGEERAEAARLAANARWKRTTDS